MLKKSYIHITVHEHTLSGMFWAISYKVNNTLYILNTEYI